MFGALIEYAIICTVADIRSREAENSSSNADSTRDSSTVRARGFNVISVGLSGESKDGPEVTSVNCTFKIAILIFSQ